MVEYVDIEYPIAYDGPINVDLLYPMQMAEIGSLCFNRGSNRIYLQIPYIGKRIEKTTRLKNTPYNRLVAQAILNELVWLIKKKKFAFSERFPNASHEQKVFYSKLEGHTYHPSPDQVLFKDYADHFIKNHACKYSIPTQSGIHSAVYSRLVPFFGEYTFFQINQLLIIEFVQQLRDLKTGGALSKKRVVGIMTELRRIWFSAYREYHWVGLVNPFEDVSHYYPRPQVSKRVAFRFPEYVLLKKYLPEFYHPIVDFLVLTGARASEALGLKVQHITNEHIHFQESRVEKYHGEGDHGDMKDLACNRKMPITIEIQKRLNILLDRTDIEYLLVDENGDPFSLDAFRNKIWTPAAKKAGINHKPQELRHTFTAWCHIAGIDKIRITQLMGHNNKARVDDTYGFYVDGLEDDRPQIIEFYGEDFVKSNNVIEQPLLSKRGSKNPHRNR